MSFMWGLDRIIWEVINLLDKILEKSEIKYTDYNICNNPLLHCHCSCPYCGKRDDCKCALFDTVTGG